jgi:hypothetical protein
MEPLGKTDSVHTVENDKKVLRRFYDPTGRPKIMTPDAPASQAQRPRSSAAPMIVTAVLICAVIAVVVWLLVGKITP